VDEPAWQPQLLQPSREAKVELHVVTGLAVLQERRLAEVHQIVQGQLHAACNHTHEQFGVAVEECQCAQHGQPDGGLVWLRDQGQHTPKEQVEGVRACRVLERHIRHPAKYREELRAKGAVDLIGQAVLPRGPPSVAGREGAVQLL
jgi:hypothetical protein